MASTTVSEQFEVTLPKDVCDELGITPGTEVEVVVAGNVMRLVRIPSVDEPSDDGDSTNTSNAQDKMKSS